MTKDIPTNKEIATRILNAFVELREALVVGGAPKGDIAPLDQAILLYKGILVTLEEEQA